MVKKSPSDQEVKVLDRKDFKNLFTSACEPDLKIEKTQLASLKVVLLENTPWKIWIG